MRSNSLSLFNETDKINSNLNISMAISYIIQSVNSSNIRAVGCDKYFNNDFNKISEIWRRNVTLSLLNVEQKYVIERKLPKNDFILMFMDQQFDCLQTFIEKFKDRIRKHKLLIIFRTENCDHRR